MMDTGLKEAPCCYFSAGDDGLILEANDTLARGLGYAPEELTGRKLETIFTIATRIFYQTHLFPLLRIQGEAAEIFITLRTKDGADMPVLIQAARRDCGGRTINEFAGITVHNRKKFEEELIAARRAAEAALQENTALAAARKELQEQMEALDRQMALVRAQHEELRQFNRVATHDLQEPIRKMSVFSHMLMDGLNEKITANPAPVAEKLLRVAESMRSVLSGLQQYVWLTEHPKKVTRLTLPELLPAVQEELAADFPGVALTVDLEPLPPFAADKQQMHLLLYHLLANAIRFRKEGTAPQVQVTGAVTERNRFRTISDKYTYQPGLQLRFTDNGIGFDPQYRHQVFDLFRKLHDTSGRGVGLALCKKIIGNHSGTLTIDSQPGVGTTVDLWLPLVPPDPGADDGADPALSLPFPK